MTKVLNNITLYNTIKSRNDTILITAIERIRNNLSDDEYSLIQNIPNQIESHIEYIMNFDDALDCGKISLEEQQQIISFVENNPAPNSLFYNEEQNIFKSHKPLSQYFTQPELIHLIILFDCGKKLAKIHASIQDLFNNSQLEPHIVNLSKIIYDYM